MKGGWFCNGINVQGNSDDSGSYTGNPVAMASAAVAEVAGVGLEALAYRWRAGGNGGMVFKSTFLVTQYYYGGGGGGSG